MAPDPLELTQLLRQWGTGDRQADDRLFELLLPDLRKIAGRCFRGERLGHTLQPTALVNEAFLRLAKIKNIDWQERGNIHADWPRVVAHFCLAPRPRSRAFICTPLT